MTAWRTQERENRARRMHENHRSSLEIYRALSEMDGPPMPAGTANILFWLEQQELAFSKGHRGGSRHQ